MIVLIIIILILLGALAGGVFILFNALVRARNRVDQATSDIDVQLKRRWDLVPNLIESVKGYMKHERETLDAIVKARSDAMKAQPNTSQARQAENMLEGALKSLFALAENYPDLKASQNFLQLQEELVDTEDKIQAARRLYNSTLRNYIDKTQMFPSNIVANVCNFKVNSEYFEIEDAEKRDPVKVSF